MVMNFKLNSDQRKMVEKNVKLAYWKAHKWAGTVNNYNKLDDFISCCEIGLIKAAYNWDDNRNNKFATYANVCMDNEVKQYLREDKKKEMPFSSAMKDSEFLDNIVYINTTVDVSSMEAEEYDMDSQIYVRKILKKLPDKEYNVIFLYYYLDFNQYEIAKILGLSQSYVSRIKIQAIKKLRIIFLKYN